jgi:tetratricopeptide (TPR) repeat protein
MRAANKGRNLRPRNSQLPEAPVDEPVDDVAAETSPVEEAVVEAAAPSSVPSPWGPLPPSEPPPPPVTDPRAKETEREPAVAHLTSSPAAPKVPVIDSAPVSVTQPSVASVVPKHVSEPPPPVTAASAKVEAPKPAPEPKKTEPVKAGEPRKTEPVKAEEPKKAEPVKAEEPRKAEPVKAEPRKAEEPKKAALARAEEPKRAAAAEPKPSSSRKGGRAEEPGSRRPASLRAVPALDEELDPSSISAEFFRKDQDSVPPVEEHEEEHEAAPIPVLSPTALARRARLRRLVAGVVSFAGVISIAVVGKQVFASKRIPTVAVVEARRDSPPADEPKPAEPQKAPAPEPAKADEKKPEEAKKDDVKKDDAKPEEAKKDDAKKEDAKPEEAKPEEAKKTYTPAELAALKRQAQRLLDASKWKDAIEKSREAIEADPSDAELYLYLGTALQSTGKWKDGIEAFSECVRHATKGPVHECRQFGGRK